MQSVNSTSTLALSAPEFGSRSLRVDRKTLRDRERKSRVRRAALLSEKRAVLEVLENVAAILPTLMDRDDAFWNSVLDPDAARMRSFLKRSMQLAQEKRQLERTRSQLSILLEEHRLASIAIEGLVGRKPSNDWEDSLRRWRAITLQNYSPRKMEDCLVEVETAQKELNAYMWSLDTEVVGASFFGWRARRRIVQSRDAVEFSFEKTFRGFPMQDFVTVGWNCYTKQEVYGEVTIGDRALCFLEMVQQLTPELVIVRCYERFKEISLDAHVFYLVSRSKTGTGYLQFVRTMYVPEVQNKINEHTDMWASNFVWLSFEALNDDATDYRAHIGGKLSGRDANYAAQWLMETLAVLLRAERMATRRGLLSSF